MTERLEYHELANIFPLIQGVEFDELVKDIQWNGLQEPIILYEGKILDGRNRYNACLQANVEPSFVQYQGAEPLSFVVSLNLRRRHLSESQRAMVAQSVANLGHGKRRSKDVAIDTSFSQVSQPEAAEMLNVSRESVIRAAKVAKSGDESLIEAVEQGQVSVSAASDLTELPKEEQKTIVLQGEEEVLKKAKEIRQQRASVSKEKREEARKEALKIKPPEGSYRTIVIDPPWEMTKIDRDLSPNQVDFDYPTMSIEDIVKFKIPCHEECHLWLWTTQKYLPDSFNILKEWGFTYLVTCVWHKNGGFQPVGLPQYNCEFVILARRGGQPFLETKAFPVCFEGKRREHSRKPEEFYDLVKRVSPEPRIDIFSRESREGFDQFGNEKDKFDVLQ
mgnify:FL=1|tara:strand:- start:1203 stop:2375 length:1173 start_codon:yes stop_codon:yes gene_type:complete